MMTEYENRREWTDKEEEYLKEKWGTETAAQISDELDRSRKSVQTKAYRLGIRS